MTTEKILFRKGRVSIHFVKPCKGYMKYFDCFYIIPTLLTYSINTYSRWARYYFTRYTGIHFLWWSIEVGVEYGKVKTDNKPGFSAIKEAMENLCVAVGECGAKMRDFKTHRTQSTEHDFTNDLINNAQ